jgi:hypothetical protein
MPLEDIQVLQGLVELFNYCDLLIVELNLMLAHDLQHGHCSFATQKLIIFMLFKL